MSIKTSALPANVHQVFTPLMTNSPLSVSRVAIVVIAPLSDPKSGSVTATAAMISPLASLGNQCCFCSSVAPWMRAWVRISGRVMSEPPTPSEPHDSSSVATTIARYSASPPSENPPYSCGIDSPNVPSSANPLITSSGMSALAR